MSALAALARPSLGLAAAVAAAMRAIAGKLNRAIVVVVNRRQVSGLLEADPTMLRDLGLTPMDIRCALAEPMWKDPSARLLIWSIERRAAQREAARDNLYGLAPQPHAPEAEGRSRATC